MTSRPSLPRRDGAWRVRQQALATWARTAESKALDKALAELFAGDALDRRDAVFIAGLSNRLTALEQGLLDGSRLVRACAVSFAGSRLSAASLGALLPALPPSTRTRLTAAVSRARRGDVASALAAQALGARDHHAARPVLSWADETAVRRAFEEGGLRAVQWKHVAERFPSLVLELFERALAAADRDAATFGVWEGFAAAVPALARARPGPLLTLLERFGPQTALPPALASTWPLLLGAVPGQVIAVVEALRHTGRGQVPRAILRRAPRLPPELLSRLARAVVEDTGALVQVLEALPPSRRADCFREATLGLDTSARWWPGEVLAVLPHAVRHLEAQRMRQLPVAQRDPALALSLVPWLPEEEALPLLAVELKSADAELRAAAWSLRLRRVAAERRGLEPVLGELERLRNEQDPVRSAVVSGLAGLPVSLFTDAAVAPLRQLVEATVTARDASTSTRAGLQQLAHRLLRGHAETPTAPLFSCALAMLVRLAEQGPSLSFPRLDAGLRRGAEVPLVAALLPWLRKEVAREVNATAIGLARALGERARGLPALQALLEEIVFAKSARTEAQRSQALSLWLDGPDRDGRIERLLKWDSSAVIFPEVWRHLHRWRQDLLAPYVAGRPLKGRFGSDKTGWLFPAVTGFQRWSLSLQHTFARTLGSVVADEGQQLWGRAACLRTLARLPTASVAELEPITRSKEVNLAEAALAGLAWLDSVGPSLPVLMANLDSDRARVAMYAIPRVARELPPAQVLAALDTLLARGALKVTVRKEVVRLLGALPGPEVTARLTAEWHRERAHRDVKRALLTAVRPRLHEEAAWGLLEAAAQSADREVALALLNLAPRELPGRHVPRFAALVIGLVGHADPLVRQEALARLKAPGGWTAAAPARAAATVSALLLARSVAVPWPDAAAVLALASAHVEALPSLREAASTLAAQLREDPPVSVAGAEDLPSQARLEALCAGLLNVGAEDRSRTRAGRAELWQALSTVPDTLAAVAVSVALVDLPVATGALDAVLRVARGHLDGRQLSAALEAWVGDASRAATSPSAVALAESLKVSDPWAALGLGLGAAARFGWSPSIRALLGELRQQEGLKAAARERRAP